MKLQEVRGPIRWCHFQSAHALVGEQTTSARWFEHFDALLASTPLVNPYLRRTQHCSWIVRHDHRIIGRITVMRCRDGGGRFGFFNCIRDFTVASMLTNAAEQWCRDQGVKQIIGPFNPSIHESCGLLVHAERPLLYGYPETPPHLISCLEANGYSKVKRLYAFRQSDRQRALHLEQRMAPLLQSLPSYRMRLCRAGWGTVARDAAWLEYLINRCWHNNWGFEPITPGEAMQMLLRILLFLPHGSLCFMDRDGLPAGITLAVPDAREIAAQLPGWLGLLNLPALLLRLRRGHTRVCRIALLGVIPELQGKPLGLAASCRMLQHQIQSGLERSTQLADMGWILEDNQAMLRFLRLYGGRLATTHVIMGKDL